VIRAVTLILRFLEGFDKSCPKVHDIDTRIEAHENTRNMFEAESMGIPQFSRMPTAAAADIPDIGRLDPYCSNVKFAR
jgi:hypothetical protein